MVWETNAVLVRKEWVGVVVIYTPGVGVRRVRYVRGNIPRTIICVCAVNHVGRIASYNIGACVGVIGADSVRPSGRPLVVEAVLEKDIGAGRQ